MNERMNERMNKH